MENKRGENNKRNVPHTRLNISKKGAYKMFNIKIYIQKIYAIKLFSFKTKLQNKR